MNYIFIWHFVFSEKTKKKKKKSLIHYKIKKEMDLFFFFPGGLAGLHKTWK